MVEQRKQVECDVYGVLALTMHMSRPLGVAPLNIRRHGNGWRVSLSPVLYVYSFILIAVMDAMVIAAIVEDLNTDPKRAVRMRSHISAAVWLMDAVIVILIANLGVCIAPMQMKNMIICMNRIDTVMSSIKNSPLKLHSEKRITVIFLVYTLSAGLLFCVDMWRNLHTILPVDSDLKVRHLYYSYYVEDGIMLMLIMQFLFIGLHVHSALKTINETLENVLCNIHINNMTNNKRVTTLDSDGFTLNATNMDAAITIPAKSINILVKSTSYKKTNYSDPVTRTELVRRLVHGYTTICDIMRQVNSCNGVLLLLLLISFLVHLVITPYNFIINLFESSRELIFDILLQLCWSMYHISKMVILVEPGHRMQYEMLNTKVLVGQLINRKGLVQNEMSEVLELFFKQIMLNEVSYSPLGMCTLARPLITTIIGGVTTYLVIMVQFHFV